tara:strand:- start:714 stop:1238 length:525 start_codon:yes stop_codon:yes gene_type:complete
MNNKKVISAVLLVSDGAIDHEYFMNLLQIEHNELIEILKEINTDLENVGIGFYIKFDNSKSDIVTKAEISELLSDVKPPPILKGLSTPALETLAIIAYEQPVTKLKISEIRGVESESSIKTLESRGLIEKGGELDVPGNPILYTTTNLFLTKLDVSSISNLPTIGNYFGNSEEE